MTDHSVLVAYDLFVGVLASLVLCLLLYRNRVQLRSRPPIAVSFVGLFLFVLADPLVQLTYRPAIHFVHGLAALLVAYGLYDPMHNRLRRTEWSVFLCTDPNAIRSPPEWMTPMDGHILQTLETAGLVLTPSLIARNIDRSRGAVSRRLNELAEHGLVKRVDRGKYEITDRGRRYLEGEPIEDGD
ncbi:MarR family transcriptional regulator [Natronolimnohabitans sp. A-GB9]|uniref:MarR family transcriptional regulator n=1 Tax=Natronolimnohabitans sp. A-GB9 TaxID=3069757 RepID=UPI0027B018D2|nr:MarR family transcriptional regulator [Natronolimnohabitans sp. A-GB9]MDQ2049483.1 MarR family transcriptional regulator [Natronolimnohabitans sp. A-GB9]